MMRIQRYIHGPAVDFFDQEIYDTFGFSDVVKAGGFLHIAGVVPLKGGASAIQVMGEGDFRVQFEWVLGMMKTLVTKSGGRFPDDMVQVDVMTTDMSQLNANADVFAKTFAGHFPALTFVGVAQLFHPAQLVEIKGVAYIGDR